MTKTGRTNLGLFAFLLLSVIIVPGHVLTEEPASALSGEGQAVLPAGVSSNVTFDFKDADIQNVLKIISYKAGVNIISSADVAGTVTIRLTDVPWEEALKAILAAHNFAYEWIDNKIIMVMTQKDYTEKTKTRNEEKKASLEMATRQKKEMAELVPLDTQAFTLNYSKADEIKTAIQNLISARGKIMLEPRTNTLIVTDTKENLAKIDEIIKKLDRMTPQVLIEAKIIETTLGNAEKLGIDWNLRASLKGSQRPITFPFRSDRTAFGSTYFPKTKSPDELDRVETTQSSAESGAILNTTTTEQLFNRLTTGFPDVPTNLFTFGTLDFTEFQVIMEILNQSTDTKILSNPRIVTLNNREAKILVGSVVPIPNYEYSKDTGTRVVSGYTDQEIGVGLSVVPNINERDYITLNVRPTIDQIIGYTGPNNERPIISTRNAETNVMIKDGQTLVIGGLISEKKSKFKKKVPVLGNIPVLDYFFSKKEDTIDRTELLIFVSPHIVKDNDFRTANANELKAIEDAMLTEAQATMVKKKEDKSLVGQAKEDLMMKD